MISPLIFLLEIYTYECKLKHVKFERFLAIVNIDINGGEIIVF